MPREIKETVVKVLSEQEIDANNKTIIRIVRWNSGRPQLEKRKFYQSENTWKPGKAAGFNIDDFLVLKDSLEEIENLLKTE
jgi:hypothetical protein